ncbi:MAG TPA: hypothetical protein VHY82_12980 [Acetobacteraceae bacterium]|nr:hypothetical protein [Acetobacteraceae bacterium]
MAEPGAERAVVGRAANLQEQIGTLSGPAHLLVFRMLQAHRYMEPIEDWWLRHTSIGQEQPKASQYRAIAEAAPSRRQIMSRSDATASP